MYFLKILHSEIKMNQKTNILAKYGAFFLNNKVSVHRFCWIYRPKRTWFKSTCISFLKICRIQIKTCPQTSIEPKYSAFDLNNKVTVHGLVLLVQLSWQNRRILFFSQKWHNMGVESYMVLRLKMDAQACNVSYIFSNFSLFQSLTSRPESEGCKRLLDNLRLLVQGSWALVL